MKRKLADLRHCIPAISPLICENLFFFHSNPFSWQTQSICTNFNIPHAPLLFKTLSPTTSLIHHKSISPIFTPSTPSTPCTPSTPSTSSTPYMPTAPHHSDAFSLFHLPNDAFAIQQYTLTYFLTVSAAFHLSWVSICMCAKTCTSCTAIFKYCAWLWKNGLSVTALLMDRWNS